MNSELHSKTVRAGIWSLIEAICLRGLQFVVGIILARLLLPEQFGLVGMLMVFMAIAQTFLDSGFGAALIHKQNISEKDICSVFYFNLLMGIVAAICLCVAAPYVSSFYNQPVLTPMLRALSLVLVINAFGLVQGVLLTRAIDFKMQTKVTIIASFLSGFIGIGMAYWGYGVWSLVAQQIANAIFRSFLLWIYNSWRPSWLFSFQSLQEMFGFGSRLLASGLLHTVFSNIYLVVIGKLFTPTDLGYFTRANGLQEFLSMTLSSVVGRVTFPVFSTIQNDPDRIKRGMKKALTILMLINAPLMIGLAVVARPLVLVLLTAKWAPCIPYLQLLALVGLLFPLHLINLNVLQALGHSDLFLRLEIIKKVLIICNIAITFRWGIEAMIIGQVITSSVSYYLNAYYNKALLNYSIWEQIGDLYPYLLNALLMGGAAYSLVYLSITSPLLLLTCQIALGSLVYLTMCQISQPSAYTDLQKMVISRLRPLQTL
ncbi:MAG TPA: flippase [Clostridiales bacterium]|jgi:O-antigen/teichoic acid export membrane protein|nr:flippase [Clostridiales bacterium]